MIDLYGSSGKKPKQRHFDADSLACIWSNGKTISSILLGMLSDAGLVSYDDKISLHWPEFGKNGKDFVKVKDLMRHEAGLSKFKEPI